MNSALTALLVALQFLTRLPLLPLANASASDFARATLAFPIVGLLIGLFLWLIQALISDLPLILQAGLILLAWVWITGNLHLDGLADSADAWVGGHGDRDRTLAIMKDPTCGPSGVTSVVLVLLIKFAALITVIEINSGLLILAPLIARSLLLPWFVLSPYVRNGGLATAFVQELNPGHAWIATGVSALFVLFLFGGKAFFVLLFAAGLMMYWRKQGMRRIGGITGDTSGAMIEMVETSVLVLVLLFGVV